MYVPGQGYTAGQASSILVSSFTLSLSLPRTSPTVGGVLGLSLVPHSSSIGERPSTGTLHPVSGRLVVLAEVTVSGNMLILIVFEKISLLLMCAVCIGLFFFIHVQFIYYYTIKVLKVYIINIIKTIPYRKKV